MIFVTLGTSEPFDRLLRAVGELETSEELVVQYGTSTIRPAGAECVAFLRFDELLEYVRRARVVVTHAGAGTVLAVLRAGKHPIVVPRLRRFGEAVDDHQLDFARRLRDAGVVTLVEEPARLAEAIAQTLSLAPIELSAGALAADLRAFVERELGTVLAGAALQSP